MASPRSFAEIIAATAQQKLAAAKARQAPATAVEKPREAILAGLRIVAETIASDGFAFSSSGPKFTRKTTDLSFEIAVQSDRNNVAGQRAAIWVHAAVYSRSLSAWRKAHESPWIRPNAPFPLPAFTTQLGYLCDPPAWVEWDFCDVAKRDLTANDLICSIRTGAYRLFSIFEGSIEGVAALVDRDWPPPEGIISYLLSQGHDSLADQTLRSYLNARPKFRTEFEALKTQFSQDGLPSYRTAIPHDLAAFAVATGFPWHFSSDAK